MTVNQQEWLEALARFRDEGRSCCQVVVTGVKGSAPREVGARMIVADGKLAWGTIGGGTAGAPRHSAGPRAARGRAGGHRDRVRAALREGGPVLWGRGQPLPGVLLLDTASARHLRLRPRRPGHRRPRRLHGPRRAAHRLALRPGGGAAAPRVAARTRSSSSTRPRRRSTRIPADSLLLVMTHSHAIDQDVIARALPQGLLPLRRASSAPTASGRASSAASSSGARRADALASVTCPIGLSKGSKEPRKIALSVAAEIVEVAERLAQEQQALRLDGPWLPARSAEARAAEAQPAPGQAGSARRRSRGCVGSTAGCCCSSRSPGAFAGADRVGVLQREPDGARAAG